MDRDVPPQVTANVYFHASNQLSAVWGQSFDLSFCCSSNVHQGFPKFVLAGVHIDRDGSTTVISGYSPTVSTLPDGTVLSISGAYPFGDVVSIRATRAVRLKLRIPCFCDNASLTTVDTGVGRSSWEVPGCAFAPASLSANATLTVAFRNRIRLVHWPRGGVEVRRGALTFALRPATVDKKEKIYWPSSTTTPEVASRMVFMQNNASWNYALLLSSLRFVGGATVPKVPFSDAEPPAVTIHAQGRRVPGWGRTCVKTSYTDGHCVCEVSSHQPCGVHELPPSPLNSSEAPGALEPIVLVPFGATNLRISVFPTLKE
jgi:hypothetical protein